MGFADALERLRAVAPEFRIADFLPRYNFLKVSVERSAPGDLGGFTIRVLREGSSVGGDNIEYVTVPIAADLQLRATREVEGYVFDPFNVPFGNISIDASARIDLTSRMRVKYTELQEFL